MTENTPDAVKVAREAAASYWAKLGNEKTAASILAGKRDWLDTVQSAILGARAMQAAMAAPAGVREDYAAICKELGCIEKPGVPLRFIQEMRKNLTAAGERIDWLLRSWDDATITERQELDRMRRGWGPTTPTERMLRHRDLRDCMQALSGALTDLTTPEDDNAEPEVEARLQEAYDRVNKRYLASLEILRRLDEPLERPDLEPAGAREGAEVPEPLYKRVEAILDEHSAWIARPNAEVTKRIALAAMFAAHSLLTEEEAPEDSYLRDGAEDPTPAPDIPGLVSGLRVHIAALGVGCCSCGAKTFQAEYHDANCKVRNVAEALDNIDDLAETLTALQAETDGWRKATWEAREGIVQRDEACASMHRRREELMAEVEGLKARATTAEAERDALKAEVERLREAVARKDRSLLIVKEQLGEGVHTGLRRYCDSKEANQAWVGIAQMPAQEWRTVIEAFLGYAEIDAALSPAKGG